MHAIIRNNMKSWDEILPHVEFVYNMVVHSSTHYSPFKIVYGFNPLTPLMSVKNTYFKHSILLHLRLSCCIS